MSLCLSVVASCFGQVPLASAQDTDPQNNVLRSENGFRVSPFEGRVKSNSSSVENGPLRAEAVEVTHINQVEIPATAEGKLMDLIIEEGDIVEENDKIAIIDIVVASLTVGLKEAEETDARIKASDDVNLRDAQNNSALAEAEYKTFVELHDDGAVPYWDMKRKQLESKKQLLRIELAEIEERSRRVQVIIKQAELNIAKAELDKRNVTSPLTGFVEERLAQKGQWVQPGTPLFRIIQMDRLRVEGDMYGLDVAARVVKGMPVEVQISTSKDNTETISAVLGYVSMNLDSNGNHRVWVEIQNRRVGDDWLFKPGMKAAIIIKE